MQAQTETTIKQAPVQGFVPEYTEEVARETAHLYKKVAKVIPEIQWMEFAPYIYEINRLKKEKDAVILAHNYMTPEIFHCVADYAGDSLQLAQEASKVKAQVIVQAGVHFMAETSKILSPDKTVLIPDMAAGCSLAESITAADVRLLREQYPNVPIVTYVNTSAEVKAESDVCCTSSNALAIIESYESDEILMIPDKFLAANIAKQTKKRIHTYEGSCEVHEQFTPEILRGFRKAYPNAVIIAHPECPPEVCDEADFSGSTSAMINYVQEKQPPRVVMITECSMSDNVSVENPNVEFVRPCNLCPHMKRISLKNILSCLQNMEHEVFVDEDVAIRAKRSVDRMLAVKF